MLPRTPRRRRLFTISRWLILTCLLVVTIAPEWPPFQDEYQRLRGLVGLREFDFLLWELDALQQKVTMLITNSDAYLDEDDRAIYFLEYLDLLRETRRLENEINRIFSDPNIADPNTASTELQQQVALNRARLLERQPIAEAILEDHVADVLVDEGFGLFGTAWPPVQMHMTPLPTVLIVSPRDEIRQVYNIPLLPGLTTPEREALEQAIFEELGLAALVVNIGGLGIYPAMILESTNINFLADVTAHEWTHHWLTLNPLGLHYAASPELRTINETVANVVEAEVGPEVIARYYPDFVPQPAPATTATPSEPDPNAPPPFDFRAEMRITRLQVDELLAQGESEAAEAYMDERQAFFVANGYTHIRKINQAYFAFYGAYADRPGATGSDPIGPTVLAIRSETDSLREFLEVMAGITSAEELFAVYDTLQADGN